MKKKEKNQEQGCSFLNVAIHKFVKQSQLNAGINFRCTLI